MKKVAYKYGLYKAGDFDINTSKILYPTFNDSWNTAQQEAQLSEHKNCKIIIRKIYNDGLDSPMSIYIENIKARISAKKYLKISGYVEDIKAYFDLDGNLLRISMAPGVVKKRFPNTDFFKDSNRFGALFGGDIISGSDNKSFFFIGGCFYVYIPNPFNDRRAFLSEKERYLLYKIMRIINEFNPREDDVCTVDVYINESWNIFQILKAGGKKENINAFWAEFKEECVKSVWYEENVTKSGFLQECEEVT